MDEVEALRHARRLCLWVFGIASFLAIALGAVAMAQADVPLGIWIRNPIAWVIAAGLSIFLASRGWLGSALLPIAVAAIALSFVGAGQEGVHRWLTLGPIQLNAAALVLPAAIAAFARTGSRIAIPCFVLIAALLAWQPDMSQLAAFAIAGIILSLSRWGWPGLGASVLTAAAAIALCLSRPDPLAPVAHVEGIFSLAAQQSVALAIAMGISLAAAALTPLIKWLAFPLGMVSSLALAAYLAISAGAFLFGAYPVPLAGYGLSFVIGWWLAIALIVLPTKSRPGTVIP